MGKIVYDELHRKTGLRHVLESHTAAKFKIKPP
jgi:hypothetical protein